MKYLLIAGLLLLLLVIVYARLRPYIAVARRIVGSVRGVRAMSEEAARMSRSSPGRVAAAGEPLLRCAACGTWFPESRALHTRANADQNFCSSACLDARAVAANTTTHTSGA